MTSRRSFLQVMAACALSAPLRPIAHGRGVQPPAPSIPDERPFFLTRGLVLVVQDLTTLDWPQRAKAAGLTTLATHIWPHEIAEFVTTERGQAFLEACGKLGIQVEHELHAMSDFLPRSLFEQDPAMFPMNDRGERVRDYNLCVHSERAVEIVCENAAKYTRLLRSTSGRYFYWTDDGSPMCRCPECRGLSDSDQALILENRVLEAIRRVDERATLAHLAYARTLKPPSQVKPRSGVFLEFAPISRVYDRALRQRDAGGADGPGHGELLDLLDANLAVFGREGAQALEYWLDASRFSSWNRKSLRRVPWDREVYLDDLRMYADRGVRHVTSFGAWLDADYVERFGEPPVAEYGEGMRRWTLVDGRATEARGP